MSNQHLIAAIWNLDIPDPIAKYVLVAISRNATKDGIARTSIEKLVTCTSLPKLDVYKSILTLQESGWIVIQRGADSDIQPPSEPNGYLRKIVNTIESESDDYPSVEVMHEVWFFCINKRRRKYEPVRVA